MKLLKRQTCYLFAGLFALLAMSPNLYAMMEGNPGGSNEQPKQEDSPKTPTKQPKRKPTLNKPLPPLPASAESS